MSVAVVDAPVPPPGSTPTESPQERAWRVAESEAVAVMGVVNAAVARLVAAVRVLLEADGWAGRGIRSPEHWLTWKAGISRARAEGLVCIARRAGDLPACWSLFEQGRLGEDAMVRIARRVPAARDAQVAALAPQLLIAQLDRLLRSLPDQPGGEGQSRPEPERMCRLRQRPDGWLRGEFCLPPDEAAVVDAGLTAARDAEFRDRSPEASEDDPADAGRRGVSWADGLVRMARVATDALDATLQRTGQPGDRHHVVLHHDVDPDGTLRPGQLELGAVVPDAIARYLACDATVQVYTYRLGRLVGIHPAQRTPNRALRHYLARRDQGCIRPVCTQRRWLHAHHITHWQDGGPTVAANLLLLCPYHHRALHTGEFRIVGDPEAGTLCFLDRFGRPIAPPLAEPLPSHSFTWN
ncbi:MAG TPA: DUF222 domain-containing protein [Acidimicrobiales bacterium]